MRYNQIRKMDISNGPGIRVSLFTQGCTQHCEGCFNSETWDLNSGKEFTQEVQDSILELCKSDHIRGLSILGGEPLLPSNCKALRGLIEAFKQQYPTKDIWLWTGYYYETLSSEQLSVLHLCDYVIDGPFVKSKKDLTLKYAGSTNQRLLHIINNKIHICKDEEL